jgi:hypothetical protein
VLLYDARDEAGAEALLAWWEGWEGRHELPTLLLASHGEADDADRQASETLVAEYVAAHPERVMSVAACIAHEGTGLVPALGALVDLITSRVHEELVPLDPLARFREENEEQLWVNVAVRRSAGACASCTCLQVPDSEDEDGGLEPVPVFVPEEVEQQARAEAERLPGGAPSPRAAVGPVTLSPSAATSSAPAAHQRKPPSERAPPVSTSAPALRVLVPSASPPPLSPPSSSPVKRSASRDAEVSPRARPPTHFKIELATVREHLEGALPLRIPL